MTRSLRKEPGPPGCETPIEVAKWIVPLVLPKRCKAMLPPIDEPQHHSENKWCTGQGQTSGRVCIGFSGELHIATSAAATGCNQIVGWSTCGSTRDINGSYAYQRENPRMDVEWKWECGLKYGNTCEITATGSCEENSSSTSSTSQSRLWVGRRSVDFVATSL